MPDVVSLLIVSFTVGIVIGLTGMGGGALMTPALIFFGVPPSAAVANDLVAAAANKSVGAAVHWKDGSPNFQLAKWLIIGSVPTAFVGAFVVDAVGTSNDQEAFMKAAIGVALLLAALTYVARIYVSSRQRVKQNKIIQIRPIPTLLLGAFGGLMVGITSVGSGSVIMVILLLLYPALAPRALVGTDLVQAIPLVMSAAVSHVIVTGIDWQILIPLILGGSPGTFLGARLVSRVPQTVVRRGIILVLFLTGLVMLDAPNEVVFGTGGALLVMAAVGWPLLRGKFKKPGGEAPDAETALPADVH